jgi:RNA methyltransferase, TrmH family
VITSVGNPLIKRVRRLRKRMWRERTSRVLIEGHRAVRSAVSGRGVDTVLYTPTGARLRGEVLDAARSAGARAQEISPAVMAYLTSATTAPDVLAVGTSPLRRAESIGGGCTIIFSEVKDPATLGSMMATAVAAGAGGLVIGPGCTDVLAPKCIRSAQGAHFLVPVVRAPDLGVAVAGARERGAPVFGVGVMGHAPWDVKLVGDITLLVAGEGSTGSDLALADDVIAVPAPDTIGPSLASRVAIVLYEWVRQGAHSHDRR